MRQLSRFLPSIISTMALAMVGLLMLSHSASAAPTGGQDITMSPASTQLSVAPGASVTKSFDLTNGGDEAYAVTTSVEPYSVTGEAYDPTFKRLPGTTDVTDWVQVSNQKAQVAGHKMLTVDYTVTVPAATAPGGYYAVLFAETSPLSTEGGGVTAHNRVGNVLYITVTGPVKTSGQLHAAPLGHVVIQNKLNLGVKIQNTGGVHFLSTMTIDAVGLTGKKLYHATAERYILPQTERLVSMEWTPSTPIGIYKVSRSATVAGEKQSLPDQWVFYVQPWLFWVILLVILMLVVFFPLSRRFGSGHKTGRR